MTMWSWEENKTFEIALAQIPDSPAKLEIIAFQMQKPVSEIKYRYEKLISDIAIIEAGGEVVLEYEPHSSTILPKRGSRWTPQEHKRFLEGVEKHGLRRWAAISRDFVKTRDASQVRNHGRQYIKTNNQNVEEAKEQNVEEAEEQNVEEAKEQNVEEANMSGVIWSWEENKTFEIALAQIPDSPARLETIAAQMQKPVSEIKYRYEKLISDVAIIEAGGEVVPEYAPCPSTILPKRGSRWSPQEHKLFVEGLEKYGNGNWELISRDFVRTRDATQISNHARHYNTTTNNQNMIGALAQIGDIAILESSQVVPQNTKEKKD